MKPFDSELQISNLSAKQRKYFETLNSRCTEIIITPVSALPIDITQYIDYDDVKEKQCYRNATELLLKPVIGKGFSIEYCEGYMNVYGIFMDHAFNKLIYDGQEFYFDLTSEKLKLEHDYEFENKSFYLLKSYKSIELMDKLLTHECYGPFTEDDIRNELNN